MSEATKPIWFTAPEVNQPATALPEHVRSMLHGIGLGISVLAAAKVTCWADLDGVLPEPLRLTDTQMSLVNANTHVLGLLRPKSKVAICPVCGRWQMYSSTAPSRCNMSLHCDGKPVQAKPFRRAEVPPED
ncbi:hypothetical protein ATK17_1848 [Branchiibius hedensis]|uniref:Uncharacterized protein n=1 Tax=Branchiibius hedensis TaxID=672460 RepID=A0A2Y8ZRL3_9MICO|nr:hypothetical protein [Branchiibius hedensis]PWJ25712.1 hypothetical protein ATK17_1848 [Branchiibius hedensis]SSA34525.1 hypothetical protein SAMN04489750_1848 [Branchiibius hedensis]